MERSYARELDALSETYTLASDWSSFIPDHVGVELARGSPIYVGSGASLAVAQLGVQLHEALIGVPARALTPVEFCVSGLASRLNPVVLISDSMSNPDILTVFRRASKQSNPVILLTNKSRRQLPTAMSNGRALVVTCPRPGNDGYVATNSVLSLSLGLIGIYLKEHVLPQDITPWLRRWVAPQRAYEETIYLDHMELMCVYTPDLRHAAMDLENRLAESGLGIVQLADIRNFAHGRHVGMLSRAKTQGILFLGTPGWSRLISATVCLLPIWIEHRVWVTSTDWPGSNLEMLIASFGFLGIRARRRRCDPGNPRVATFGRELFSMSFEELLPGVRSDTQPIAGMRLRGAS